MAKQYKSDDASLGESSDTVQSLKDKIDELRETINTLNRQVLKENIRYAEARAEIRELIEVLEHYGSGHQDTEELYQHGYKARQILKRYR